MQTRYGYTLKMAKDEVDKMMEKNEVKLIHEFTNKRIVVETNDDVMIVWKIK